MKRYLLSTERSRKDPLGTQQLSQDLSKKPAAEPGEKAAGAVGPMQEKLGLPRAHGAMESHEGLEGTIMAT